jgi:saccharopine dehydrogenase-like NADP-dependent oxidoreductase
MSNVLILGANGQVAGYAIDLFLNDTDAMLTLYLRNSRRLRNFDSNRARVIEGDVLDATKLKGAMAGQDVDYATLAADLERQAKSLIFVSSMAESVAALVVKLAGSPELEVRQSLGVSKPE